ncbi:MAG: N-acetyltransferase [Alphaproteobacteria bacterium]|nr:N-acetyltransferase [Alphaproteobacteria bacterium]
MIQIETDRLMLRPLRMEDAESVFEYAYDPEITTYVTWDAHKTIDDSTAYIEMAIAEQQKTPLYPLAIVFKDKPDQVIGTVGIKTGPHPYEANLSYLIARKHWRKGLAFEAAHALVNLAFAEYGFKRIYAWCIKENKASSSLMKKLGMKFEGCFRSKTFRRDRFWDVEYYAILEDEWRQQQSFAEEQEQQEYPISYEPNASRQDIAVVDKGICDYAKQQRNMDPFETFDFFVRDGQGQILAGCGGVMYHGCLYTGSLWVAESLRGKGIGTRLLRAAEQLAMDKDCSMATIHTMDWEALDFYKQLGYQVELAREGYKNNSIMYILKKGL